MLRLSSNNALQAVASRRGRGLLPYEIIQLMDKELTSKKFTAVCSDTYIAMLRKFIVDYAVEVLAKKRREHGMFDAIEVSDEWDADTDLTMGASGK